MRIYQAFLAIFLLEMINSQGITLIPHCVSQELISNTCHECRWLFKLESNKCVVDTTPVIDEETGRVKSCGFNRATDTTFCASECVESLFGTTDCSTLPKCTTGEYSANDICFVSGVSRISVGLFLMLLSLSF